MKYNYSPSQSSYPYELDNGQSLSVDKSYVIYNSINPIYSLTRIYINLTFDEGYAGAAGEGTYIVDLAVRTLDGIVPLKSIEMGTQHENLYINGIYQSYLGIRSSDYEMICSVGTNSNLIQCVSIKVTYTENYAYLNAYGKSFTGSVGLNEDYASIIYP